MSSVRAAIVTSTYCTAADVSNILNLSFTASSVPTLAQINDLIVRATSYVDQVSSHKWITQQSTEYHDAIGSGSRAGMIILRNRPVISVQEFAWWYGGIQAWIPGLEGYSEETTGVLISPSTTLDRFQKAIVSDNQQQPKSFLVYYPEGKIVWNEVRLNSRLRYRVIYTWGYTTPPDFIRDLTSVVVAIDVMTFWSSHFGTAEQISMMKTRLEERKFRLEARASQRSAAAIG